MLKNNGNIIVGIDIGTTKICTLVGEKSVDGVDIVGVGINPSAGLRKGLIIDVEAAVDSVEQAVKRAETMAGCTIESVFTGISGSHIKSVNTHGVVAVKNREIKRSDIKRSLDAAKALSVPADREIIHVLPQEFVVDDQGGIRDPLGMSGMRLEAKVHVVTGAVASARNIIKCANRTGLDVKDIILQQLASSEAVLSDDEKDLGSVLVDIGGGTTDIAIFFRGGIGYTSVIAVGGNHFTSDIAIGLRTSIKDAETLKKDYGSARPNPQNRHELIEVKNVDGRDHRTMPRGALYDIMHPRAEELLHLIRRELFKSELQDVLGAGIVLTGGVSLMPGMRELAEDILGKPVRIGYPQGIKGLTDVVNNPMYATGVGLLLYGSKRPNAQVSGNGNMWKTLIKRMREWFSEVV